jgi:hypothetical protein
MSGTITYNFDPEQTVWVITTCDRATGLGHSNPNVLITNQWFPGDPETQVSPVSGNDLIVRQGTIKELRTSLFESTTNNDGAVTVDVLGGQVTNVTIVDPGAGYYPDAYSATVSIQTTAGAITGVTIDDPGAGYTDGTGFTVNIIDPTLWAGGSIGRIGFDIVNGSLTNPSVVVPGSGYSDGVVPTGNLATEIPLSDGLEVVTLTTTAGGGDGTAEITFEIINGALSNPQITDAGDLYTDGNSILVTDLPEADTKQYKLVYGILLQDSLQRISIEVPVTPAGVEQVGDIFDNLTDAVNEYETRVS